MKMMAGTILLSFLLFLCSVSSDAGEEAESSRDSTDAGLLSLIMNMSAGDARLWAKPIEHINLDRILELKQTGLITFHEADWYSVIDDE